MTDQVSQEEERLKAVAASQAFATTFGATFAAWQSVENALFNFYLALFQDPKEVGRHPGMDMSLSNVIYHSIVHLDARIVLIDELVKFRVKDEAALDKWNTLLHKIRRRKREKVG